MQCPNCGREFTDQPERLAGSITEKQVEARRKNISKARLRRWAGCNPLPDPFDLVPPTKAGKAAVPLTEDQRLRLEIEEENRRQVEGRLSAYS